MSKYDDRKFYWLQIKEDFFEDDAIQWLEEQQNGKEYSLFYLKLCLKSLKTNGILIRNVGNMLVPYDTKKLADLTKTDFDTVLVAMELLIKIGLVKILENGEIYLQQLSEMIGFKSIGAFKKQQQRLLNGHQADICPPDIELDIDIKEKEIYKEKEIFKKPTINEIESYCKERNNSINAEKFYNHYESVGWLVGKSKMKDWKAAIRTWETNEKKEINNSNKPKITQTEKGSFKIGK